MGTSPNRHFLSPLHKYLIRPFWQWLIHGQGVAFLLISFGLIDLALWVGMDVTNLWPEQLKNLLQDIDGDGQVDMTLLDAGYTLYMQTMSKAAICLAPGFIVWILRRPRRKPHPVRPALWLCLFLGLCLVPAAVYHGLPEAMASRSGDEPYTVSFFAGIGLLVGLLCLPPITIWIYSRASTLDRYVVRTFLTPFLLCFFGFLSIWFISDMSNNGSDYAAAEMSTLEIGKLYLTQLPAVIVLVLPICLLLALLKSLGSMSQHNELISIMMSGKPVIHILRPLLLIGVATTFVSLVCNYQYAPASVGSAKSLLNALSKKKKTRYTAFDQAYMNRVDNRLWFVGLYPQDYSREHKLGSVVVVQFSEDGNLQQTLHANRAYWQRHDGLWVFFEGQITDFNEEGSPVKVTTFPKKHLQWGWPETPWKLVSSGLNPEYLGVPQLQAWMRAYRDAPPERLAPFRTHWHHRLALPMGCLVVVIFGAPLGIVYSRRGLVGSVSAAVGIFFAMLFITNFSVALGQSARIPAIMAAWSPPIFFAIIGFLLVRLRSQNREIPSPTRWVHRRISGLLLHRNRR